MFRVEWLPHREHRGATFLFIMALRDVDTSQGLRLEAKSTCAMKHTSLCIGCACPSHTGSRDVLFLAVKFSSLIFENSLPMYWK